MLLWLFRGNLRAVRYGGARGYNDVASGALAGP